MAAGRWLEEGSLGFFYPSEGPVDLGPEPEPERGFLRRDGDVAVLDVLVEDVDADRSGEPPSGIIGVLPDEGVLLLEAAGRSGSRAFGAPRAWSKRYATRTVIGRAPVDQLRSFDVRSVSAQFFGVGVWAGLGALEHRYETHPGSNLLASASITAKTVDVVEEARLGGLSLALTATWSIDGPEDRKRISSPVVVTVRSRRPRPAQGFTEALLAVQDLLGLCLGGFVPVEAASCELDVLPFPNADREPKPALWHGPLMTVTQNAPGPSETQFPLVDLATIGGARGLARWITIAQKYPRAVQPVVRPYRFGSSTAIVSLLEVGAAIEHWVKAHRPADWAKDRLYYNVLARHVGRPFETWAGSADAWGSRFSRIYNGLKHGDDYNPSIAEIQDMLISGRYLLAASVLNRCAGSKAPSRAIFEHHRIARTGHRLRAV